MSRDYFIGGALDGQALDANPAGHDTMIEADSGHVYTRQRSLDTEGVRVWIHAESDEQLRRARELVQGPAAGKKALTLDDLGAFLRNAQELNYPGTTPLRALLSWAGMLRQVRVSRDDA